jgi:hypothetical protein
MTSATPPKSLRIPRIAASVLVRQLNLPLGALGSPLVSAPAESPLPGRHLPMVDRAPGVAPAPSRVWPSIIDVKWIRQLFR